jgi:SpoVK/Ycf46/Vps4 family AAA+-type ATPase
MLLSITPQGGPAQAKQNPDFFALCDLLSSKISADTDSTQKQLNFQSPSEALGLLKDSTAALCALIDVALEFKNLGESKHPRSEQLGTDILKLYTNQLDLKSTKGERGLTDNQRLLLQLYKNSHAEGVSKPEWSSLIEKFVNFEPNDRLPIAIEIVKHSAEAKSNQTIIDLIADITSLNQALENQSQRAVNTPTTKVANPTQNAAPADLYKQINKDIEQKLAGLYREVIKLSDIRPEDLEIFRDNISFKISFNTEFLTAIHQSILGISKLISCLALNPNDALELSIFQLSSAATSLEARPVKLNFTESRGSPEVLSEVVANYEELASAAKRLAALCNEERLSDDRRADAVILANLKEIIPTEKLGAASKAGEVIAKISEQPVESAAFLGLLSLTANSVKLAGESLASKPDFLFEKPPLYQALCMLVKALLSNRPKAVELAENGFSSIHFHAFKTFCAKIRAAVEEKDYSTLTKIIDACLDKGNLSSLKNHEKFLLLTALLHLSENKEVAAKLRTRIDHLGNIRDLSQGLTALLGQTPLSSIVNTFRARIVSKLDKGLADYHGKKEMIADLLADLEEYQLFLKHPEARVGIPDNQIFLNCRLMVGKPGCGKTFLPKCLANELGWPLHIVSASELVKAGFGNGSISAKQFADFLSEEMKKARAEKQACGAIASLVFVDEADACYRRRNAEFMSVTDILNSNQMLEITEVLFGENPDMFVMGATNNIELMDPAALRIGRWGLMLDLNTQTPNDVHDILTGDAERLNVPLDRSYSPEIRALEETGRAKLIGSIDEAVKAGQGLPPLALKIARNQEVVLTRIQNREFKWANVTKKLERIKRLSSSARVQN